jgi:hypothetical protein
MGVKWYGLEKSDVDKILELVKDDTILYNRILRQHKETTQKTRRVKGLKLQKWVCGEIAAMLGIPYKQSDDQCEIHSRESALPGTDVILRGSAYAKFKYDVECKNSEKINLVEAIYQAESNTEENRDWLLVHKRKALKGSIVILSWDAFKRLWIRGNK